MPLENILGLGGYKIKEIKGHGSYLFVVGYEGENQCPTCGGKRLRIKDRFTRTVRHVNLGSHASYLELEGHKFHCESCGRYFNQRFPGILPRRRYSEAFRRQICLWHRDGICQSTLAENEDIGEASVERWYQQYLALKMAERKSEPCPPVLGIDEHFFSRKDGYATTFCDLKNRKVYDVVLGRSELALEGYFQKLRGKEQVQVVCMDLSSTYRNIIGKHMPQARIVADRFHVIRLVNHHFLAVWRKMDELGSRNRGLVSLMRRHQQNLPQDKWLRLQGYLKTHPILETIYEFKQKLCRLLLMKHRTAKQCQRLIPILLNSIDQLRKSDLELRLPRFDGV